MANLKSLSVADNKAADASSFMVGTDEFAVPIGDLIDVDAEIEKQEKELQHLKGFLAGVQKSSPMQTSSLMPLKLWWKKREKTKRRRGEDCQH